MKIITTYIIDSFTDQTFKGNPAGVCLLEEELEGAQMLSIAKELGLSETAFIQELEGDNAYSIRYFSPKMEIPLCGHATLAASKVLFERQVDLASIRFTTGGNLSLAIGKEGEEIVMEFPVYDCQPATAPKKLLAALGIEAINNSVYNAETNILLLEIEDSKVLESLKPDFTALRSTHDTISGVLVSAASQREGFDFESRYFWPWSGTNEDPVTGATHTFLAKYWSKKLGKTKMNSFQCSARSGFMQVELIAADKMTIKSKAQVVLAGELRLN